MRSADLGPIVKSIMVKRAAADAFRLFTEEIAAWWPLATHTRARDADGERTLSVTLEPRVGGRLFETLNTGEAREWGNVTVFDPPRRVAFTWHLGVTRAETSEVEVTFEPQGGTACRVTLTHHHWEKLADPETMRGRYQQGWTTVFEDCFARHAGRLEKSVDGGTT